MALSAGTRLGPYEIESPLGAGGMGEVYRARDSKLNRDVALKILPEQFALDPDRLARFKREAQVLASLNHPNIAAIYGFEESGDVRALVLELVEGSTLADRLAKGPITVTEALGIAKQIADALDAAHEKGIIHRDLKPANITITNDGTVKVLDFGLAKAATGDGSGPDLSQSPTVTVGGTREGVILGTAAYMSPEQARGRPVEKRTDIWAFGCVFYEMLTGRTPFQGETISDTIAAILEREPDWSELPESTPPSIRRLLQRSLEKDPKRRVRDIGDARADIEGLHDPVDAVAPPRTRITRMSVAVAILAVAVMVSLAGWWSATRPVSRPLVQLPLDLGPEVLDPAWGAAAILSPDGTRLVYRGAGPRGQVQLLVRSFDQDQATPVPGTEGAQSPFFSPDGQAVAFFASGKLKKVFLQGGRPVDLCEVPSSRGGSWGEDGNIIAPLDGTTPLYRIPSTGGAPQVLTDLQQDRTHRWPQLLPGAEAVVFTASPIIGDFEGATIEIQSLKTGRRTTLVRGGHFGRYATSGHLLYVSSGTLYAAPLDLEQQALTGPAIPVVENVRTRIQSGAAALDVSRSGTLIYAKGAPPKQGLAWLDATGHTEPLRAPSARYDFGLRFSPDGKRLALASPAAAFDVWTYEWERGAMARLTSAPENDLWPVWTRDGSHIVYECTRGPTYSICWMRADGVGDEVQLTTRKTGLRPYSFSPDGQWLAFGEVRPDTKGDLWILPIEDVDSERLKAGEAVPFLKTGFDEQAAMISPDGRWIAYQSNETGTDEVYVRAFPGAGGRSQISSGGGSAPVWSKTRPELFYRSHDGLMVATYAAKDGAFVPDKPRVWVAKNGLGPWFDLSPDGKRFVIIENVADEGPSPQLTLVLNFFDELRRRVAAGERSAR